MAQTHVIYEGLSVLRLRSWCRKNARVAVQKRRHAEMFQPSTAYKPLYSAMRELQSETIGFYRKREHFWREREDVLRSIVRSNTGVC